MNKNLKVMECFGGIGACSKALERLNIEHEIADYVEIDKYAVKSYNAMRGTNFEAQDITTWDKDIEVDLIMHGSPCTDFSAAGKQAGGDKDSGTRSSLLYETVRIVSNLKPKYVVWENVKNVLSKKHRHNFDNYLNEMEQLGYTNYYQVLNAKDYGIPQNRERVFTISIRNDKDKEGIEILDIFNFPLKKCLKLRLKDILEDEVDKKYYLSDSMINYIKNNNEKWTGNNGQALINKIIASTINTGEGSRRCDASNYICPSINYDNIDLKQVGILDIKGHDCIKRVYDSEGLSPTLTTMEGGNRQPKIVASRGRYNSDGKIEQHFEINESGNTNTITTVQKDNYLLEPGTIIDDTQGFDGIRYYSENSPTLRSQRSGLKTVDTSFRIRKLTPKECWRLMGFDDEDFEKASKVNSNAQLYKQAGNSIVVNVLEAIFKELLISYKQ